MSVYIVIYLTMHLSNYSYTDRSCALFPHRQAGQVFPCLLDVYSGYVVYHIVGGRIPAPLWMVENL